MEKIAEWNVVGWGPTGNCDMTKKQVREVRGGLFEHGESECLCAGCCTEADENEHKRDKEKLTPFRRVCSGLRHSHESLTDRKSVV